MKAQHRPLLWIGLLVAVVGGLLGVMGAETPVGVVRGQIVAAESGAPLPSIRVALARSDDSEWRRTRTDAQGRFSFSGVPVGVYRLVTYAEAHHEPKGKINVSEGRVLDGVYELQPVEPYITVFDNQRVFGTDEAPKLRVNGFAPAREMTVSAYRLSDRAARTAWHGALRDALQTQVENIANAPFDRLDQVSRVSRQTVSLAGRDVEGVFRQDVTLPKLAAGMYAVSMQAATVRGVGVFVVTDLGLVAKSSGDEVFVFAANVKSGEPVPGARISLRSRRDRLLDEGATDGSGFSTLHVPAGTRQVEVTGTSGASTAIASLGIEQGTEGDVLAFTMTDRPVYRPGHTVHFKSILRRIAGDGYSVPAGREAEITVTDPRQNVLYHKTLTANAFGGVWDDVPLNRAALPGTYAISVQTGGESREAAFDVAEYRKPEFEVNVATARSRYALREDVTATVSAQYYYGAAVPNANVRWSATRAPHYYYDDAYAYDEDLQGDESDDGAYGETIATGEGRTDADGRLEVRVPAMPAPDGESGDSTDYRYTIHATVTDLSKRSEDGSGGALVTQGDYRLDVKADAYFARPGQAVAVTVKAVDYDGNPVPNASGTVRFERRVWVEGAQQTRDSQTLGWQADGAGVATFALTPEKEGDYSIAIRSRDRHGSTIRAEQGLWVMAGDAGDMGYPYGDMEITPGKRLYREGETAEVLLQTRYSDQPALLTVEGTRLYETRLIRLTGKSNVVKIPIRPEYMPSVRVMVSFYRDKRAISGETDLNISREQRALSVQVTPDKATYRPGERVTWHVKTMAPDGRPVSAEVALGVVDASVYAIRQDSTPDMARFFYPKRYGGVQSAYSYPQIYLSGDEKAGAGIRTRRSFPDTAFWSPSTITSGMGEATVSFTMPDSLTTWRATARAATMDTLVGQTTAETIVSQPFLVRLEAPRFATQGDEVELAGVVHNLTGKRADVSAGITAERFSAPGADQSHAVENGATERFAWRVRAQEAGDSRIRVWARAGAFSDAMELTIPVLPKGRRQYEARTGDTAGREAFALNVRSDVVPGTQALTVRLSPSLVGAMFGSLDYLANYPYGCTEQTLSAFLPDVVLAGVLKRQGIRSPSLEARVSDMVHEGLFKLYALQNPEGGWRWFRYDPTDPWMTAYVVYGLMQARDAGFDVNPEVIGSGIRALVKASAAPKLDPDTRAFCARVLAMAGQKDAAARAAAQANTGPDAPHNRRLSDWGRAQLAMALEAAGAHREARINLAILWRHLSESAYRPTDNENWRSDPEHAAAFLMAALQVEPNARRTPDLVRWIMRQRAGDHWYSTRDTAAVIEAMSRYVERTGELAPDFTATVKVNGRVVASPRFTRRDLAQPETVITVPASALPVGPATVEVAMSGRGRLYYTAAMEQTAAMDLSQPLVNQSGLTVERAYRAYGPGEKVDWNAAADATRTRTRASSGDTMVVTLTVHATRAFDYLMVEDPIPAGCEARDRGAVDPWEWSNWWSDQIVRDQMVSFAVRHLDPGTHVIRYTLQAQVPGTFTALPPRVFDMYNPDVRGEAVAHELTVR